MSWRRDGSLDHSNVAQRVLVVGLFLVVVSVPLAVLLIRAVSDSAQMGSGFVPLPSIERTFDLLPSVSEVGFDPARWLWGLLAEFLGVVFAVIYYLVLFTALLGTVFALGGGIWIADPREIARTVRRALGLRIIQILVGAYAMVGLTIAFPATVRLGLELVLTLSLWLGVLVALVAFWHDVESADHLLGRITLWYPLTVALVVLPSVVVGIVSPTVRPWFLVVTGILATPFFDSGLVPGVLVAFFAGYPITITAAHGGFWVVVVLVMGWVVGVLTEVVAWLPARLVRLAAPIWGRVARLTRGLLGDR